MTITAKGQVTIPKPLRKQFKLRAGSKVDFVAYEGALQLVPVKTRKHSQATVDEWLAKAMGSVKITMTTDEIMAITRGED